MICSYLEEADQTNGEHAEEDEQRNKDERSEMSRWTIEDGENAVENSEITGERNFLN